MLSRTGSTNLSLLGFLGKIYKTQAIIGVFARISNALKLRYGGGGGRGAKLSWSYQMNFQRSEAAIFALQWFAFSLAILLNLVEIGAANIINSRKQELMQNGTLVIFAVKLVAGSMWSGYR